MNRLRLLCIPFGCLAVAFIAGCHNNVAGLPTVSSAASSLTGPLSDESAAGLKLSTRAMPFTKGVGSSNTITADMPVPRPDTNPCVVKLFQRYTFKNFNNKQFKYAPPAACPGPWAKVVFNLDVRVTKGVQFDRTAIIWVDGAVIYFGTTAEPSPNLSPHWHVERDVTDLSALFTQASKGQIALGNCYCPPTYDGFQIAGSYLQFYPVDQKYPAPRVPDEVIGIPYNPPLGGVAQLPHTAMEIQTTLPRNILRAYLDLYLQSQNKEEQWFMCVPDEVWRKSKHALGFCRNSPFREGLVSVDGMPAGLTPIYPWIYTGGIDPNLWFPLPGVQTLEFVPSRVDLTPFAATLSNGSTQTIDVSVVRAFSYFSGAGDLLLYRDPKAATVTGKLTQDTLTGAPDYNADSGVSYGSGVGLFGGPTAHGPIDTQSRSTYTIAGYVKGSGGRVTTTVNALARFNNKQTFDYTASKYIQLLMQDTHFDTSSATDGPGEHDAEMAAYEFPFTVSYPILPISTGFKLPLTIYQGYRALTTTTVGRRTASTQISNTVKSSDTMIFNSSFSWIGVKNGASIQLYTNKSKGPTICYGKQIESKNNVVTAITEPGCDAQPPVRHRPHA